MSHEGNWVHTVSAYVAISYVFEDSMTNATIIAVDADLYL